MDIVPFGEISPDKKHIKWPPDQSMIMNIMGFKEAIDYAQIIQVCDEPVLHVKVPTIPGMALMKIVSWHDRYPERPKDAQDLLFFMENYAESGNEDRLYGSEVRFMEAEKFDYVMAGIRLLGYDMAHMATPHTRMYVLDVLSNGSGKLIKDMAGPAYAGRNREMINNQIERLRQGFMEKNLAV